MHNLVHANVAGLNIDFIGFENASSLLSDWKAFIVDDVNQSPDLIFRFRHSESLESQMVSYYSVGSLDFHVDQTRTIFGYMKGNDQKVDVIISSNWDEAVFESSRTHINITYFKLFTDIVYRTRLSDFSGFTTHASVVEYNGGAVMFSAKSGVGKSTHAELWKEHLSAEIINGDHAIIRMIDGVPNIFGAPWSGTSTYKKRISAPLKAIVLLEQSDINTLSCLAPREASHGFLPHCYLPYWNQNSVANTLCHIDTVLGMIPVYRLKCLPDRAAAELVRAAVFS